MKHITNATSITLLEATSFQRPTAAALPEVQIQRLGFKDRAPTRRTFEPVGHWVLGAVRNSSCISCVFYQLTTEDFHHALITREILGALDRTIFPTLSKGFQDFNPNLAP